MSDRQIAHAEAILDELLAALPEMRRLHATDGRAYGFCAARAREAVATLFAGEGDAPRRFGPFGALRFPFERMGAITSLELFGLDELIIFSFYWANRGRYRRVADLGANIGLHSFCLGRAGYEVRCFEPDPMTFASLEANLARNGLETVEPIQAAVSDADGETEFVRVHGNRTGSHLAGAKPNPYGELERFPVTIRAFRPIADWADLLKIDVEGHEPTLIQATDRALWDGVDAMMEVGTAENAAAVFAHLDGLDVPMFAQKIGWDRVRSVDDVPTSHREGSLFVTTKNAMPWATRAAHAADAPTAEATR